jgi:hypothetical protein
VSRLEVPGALEPGDAVRMHTAQRITQLENSLRELQVKLAGCAQANRDLEHQNRTLLYLLQRVRECDRTADILANARGLRAEIRAVLGC